VKHGSVYWAETHQLDFFGEDVSSGLRNSYILTLIISYYCSSLDEKFKYSHDRLFHMLLNDAFLISVISGTE
jgi:hypothetical protein